MKKLIVIFFLLFVNTVYAQGNSHDVLLKTAATLQTKQSINYSIAFTYKNSGTPDDDTFKLTAEASMLRDNKDTVLGGMAWVAPRGKLVYEYLPGTFMFYDTKYAYKVFSSSKKIVYQDPHITKPTFMFDIWPQKMVLLSFLKTKEIEEFAGSDYITSMLKDTVINNNSCYSIKIKPTTEWIAKWGDTEWYHIWYINKQDYMLVAWEQWVLNGDKCQYENFHIKSYTFNKVTIDRFSLNQLPSDYKRAEIKPD